MYLVDVHSHLIIPEYLDALKKFGRSNEDGFPAPVWSVESQLAYMEAAGIAHAVMSLSSPHPFFPEDEAFSADLFRRINEFAADMKKRYPDKFSFAACLPLPNIELAIREARYCLEELGACCVKLSSQANGLYPGDPAMDPLMEYLNTRRAVIILHPSRPQAVPGGCFSSVPIPLLEFINDTTRAVINIITSGTLEKFPDIRLVVPHCGSFLPNIVDRLAALTWILSRKGLCKPVDVSASLGKMYFDLAGASFPRVADILLTLADTDHIMVGGDFPYTPAPLICRGLGELRQYAPFASVMDKICHENARRLFGLPGLDA